MDWLSSLSIGKEDIGEQENALEIQRRKFWRGSHDHV